MELGFGIALLVIVGVVIFFDLLSAVRRFDRHSNKSSGDAKKLKQPKYIR